MEIDSSSRKEIYEKNVYSVSNILKESKNHLHKNSCIVVITSRRAIRPIESEWDYSAAKAAEHSYVKSLYKSNPNLRIMSVAPGWVESKMSREGNAKNVIPVKQLCKLIQCCVECEGMRIPEIFIEPIGDSEY